MVLTSAQGVSVARDAEQYDNNVSLCQTLHSGIQLVVLVSLLSQSFSGLSLRVLHGVSPYDLWTVFLSIKSTSAAAMMAASFDRLQP